MSITIEPSHHGRRHHHRRAHRPALWISLLLGALLATGLEAEQTGQLQGTVVDQAGGALPGVRVAAASPTQIGGEQSAVTDERGFFRYPTLAPGAYAVRFDLDGHVPQELTLVPVRVDRATTLAVTMPRAAFDDELVVTEAAPVVDTKQTSAGQTLSAEYLEKAAIGRDNRNYIAVTTQAAGVNGVGSVALPQLSVHGSRSWENAFLIDGVDTTVPVDGLHAFDAIGFDSIQEIAVHTAGLGAEYGFATGGVINVVTKSGGNELSGSLDLRYRDENFETRGDHYDPDEEPTDRRSLHGTLGGRILRDRLWFFLSGIDDRGRRTPIDTPYSVDETMRTLSAKLTWQATPDWALFGRYADESLEWRRQLGSRFRAEEATSRLTWKPESLSLDSTAVLSPRLVWSAQLYDFDVPLRRAPLDGDLTTLAHFNLDTGQLYGNFRAIVAVENGRREAQTDLLWFVPDALGQHELELGLRRSELSYRRNSCSVGNGPCRPGDVGVDFLDVIDGAGNPAPLRMFAQENVGRQSFDGAQRTIFAQDAWRVGPDVTLRLGLRWDAVEQENDVGRTAIDYDLLQPRLGVAWDVAGRGRTVARASWGRFMNPSLLSLAGFLAERSTPAELWLSCSTVLAADAETCQSEAQAAGHAYRTDPESWDPAGWFLRPDLVFGSDLHQIAPGIDPIHVDALVLAVERELFRRTSLELSYIRKEARDLLEDTCIGNVPEPSPAADCSTFVLTNIAEAHRDYEGLALRFESRALDRFHAIASWVYSESTGTAESGTFGVAFDVYPWHFTNLAGYLSDHSRHRLRLNGFVELPWDMVLGLAAIWQSEIRWTPLLRGRLTEAPYGAEFAEPRGSRKADGLYNVDLQLSKAFSLGSTRWALVGSVYNLLDAERPTSFCDSVSGCGANFALGDPLSWQQPRRYEVGFRLEF